MVREGSFRSDLYFRLAGIVLRVPPLRDRLDELGGLARALVAEAAQPLGRRPPAIGSHALALLYRHAWPGNVRELRNVLHTATTLCRGGMLLPEHLPSLVRGGRAPSPDGRGPRTLRSQLAEVERARITGALEEAGGNQTRAATLLGISRRALLYRLDALGLPRPRKLT
jgi:DNA-binding NtrC family response regulator